MARAVLIWGRVSGETSILISNGLSLFLYPIMKQNEIVINGKISLDAEEIIHKYFTVDRIGVGVNGIEGFVFSEDVFYKNYQGSYAFKELKLAQYYAVYTVNRCDICWESFNVIINDRAHLYRYLQADFKYCHNCKGFHYRMGELGAFQVTGEVAS